MKHLIVLLAVATTAFTAPGGYSYNAPSGGAGSELSGSYIPASGASSSGGGVSFFPPISFSGSESASSVNEISGSYLPGQSSFDYSGVGGSGGVGGSASNGFGGANSFDDFHSIGGLGGFGGAGDQEEVFYYGDDNSQATRLRINVAPGSSSRRVIFVKSPDAGVVIPEIIAPSGASQQKTVVYVLSKQQQPHGSITIPSSLIHNVAKSRPEVYHIKYNNQQDAEKAVADTLSGHAQASNISPQSSKESFVKTLSSGQHGGISGSVIGPAVISGSSGQFGGQGGGGVFGGSKGSGQSFGGGKYGKPGLSGPY